MTAHNAPPDRPNDAAQIADCVFDARPLNDQLREACSAVLHGAIWGGFNGPTGVSKDEALDYAVKLATWVQSVLDRSTDDA